MAVFTNEEVLSFFTKVTEPLPIKKKEDIPTQFQKAGTEKFQRKQRELEARQAEEKMRKGRQAFIRPSKSESSFEGSSMHQKLMHRRERLADYDLTRKYNYYEESDEDDLDNDIDVPFGLGRPTNPNAQPGDDDYEVTVDEELYNNFSFETDLNPRLPIEDYKNEIVSTIETNQVTIIQGETGSGKSTQVAQYLLEHHASLSRHCNIVCTQPRRIAATSIAKYVCRNRGWQLGTLVGYQIGMDKLVSENTRLTFMTTGVLLEKLVHMKNMNQFTHVILDEVIFSVNGKTSDLLCFNLVLGALTCVIS